MTALDVLGVYTSLRATPGLDSTARQVGAELARNGGHVPQIAKLASSLGTNRKRVEQALAALTRAGIVPPLADQTNSPKGTHRVRNRNAAA